MENEKEKKRQEGGKERQNGERSQYNSNEAKERTVYPFEKPQGGSRKHTFNTYGVLTAVSSMQFISYRLVKKPGVIVLP